MRNRNIGIILSYINTFLNIICGLLLSAYLLRILGDTEYGLYQTISSFANYLVLLEFGTGTVMTRNLSVCRSRGAETNEIDQNVSTIWVITNILSILILLVSVLFYFLIDNIYANSLTHEQIIYGQKMFLFIVCYLVFSFYMQTLSGIILAFEKYTYSSWISIIRISVRTILLICLVYFYKASILIAIVDMLLSIIFTGYTWFFCKVKLRVAFNPKNFNWDIFKASLPLCIAIFLQVIVNQANNNVDKFIISIKMTPEDVALYSIGLYIYSIFSSLTTIPISLYVPQIASNISNGYSGKQLTDSLVQPSRLIALIGGMTLFGFIAVGQQFISILYGDSYGLAWYIAIIIMIPMFINMSNGVIVNVLDVMNKRMVRSYVLIVTTIMNIVLTVVWIDKWGMIGAAFATAVCTFLGQILVMNIYYSRVIHIKVLYMFQKTYKGILVYQIIGMIFALLLQSKIKNIYISFLICGILFAFVALGGFILFGANENERRILNKYLPFKTKGAI